MVTGWQLSCMEEAQQSGTQAMKLLLFLILLAGILEPGTVPIHPCLCQEI